MMRTTVICLALADAWKIGYLALSALVVGLLYYYGIYAVKALPRNKGTGSSKHGAKATEASDVPTS